MLHHCAASSCLLRCFAFFCSACFVHSSLVVFVAHQTESLGIQVVFFMYLWAIDTETVLTALSCFRLLCEEAEIRCSYDDSSIHQLVPNYDTYMEFAHTASNLLTTGANSLKHVLKMRNGDI